jgi:hypothetical protein
LLSLPPKCFREFIAWRQAAVRFALRKGLMRQYCILWAIFALLCVTGVAAESDLIMPLAYSSAPRCSQRPGVRSIRSDLVQYGDVTASISSQAAQDHGSCVKSAALWVTEKDTSQQFELPDAAANTFAILDVAPDFSSVLLSSVATLPNDKEDRSSRIALVPLREGAPKWMPLTEILGFHGCDAALNPQGFADATHVIIAASPPPSTKRRPTCTPKLTFFSFDLITHGVKQVSPRLVKRFAQPVAGPVHSCKTDPDVVGACYTSRGRLALSGHDQSMTLWPLHSGHYLTVEDDMLPVNLSSKVASDMRVYATMVICPLLVEHTGSHPRPHVCIDAATDFRPDPITPRPARSASRHLPSAASR